MSEEKEVEFIAQVRRIGRERHALYVTIPKTIRLYLGLRPNDFVRITIEKLEVEAKEAKE